MTEPGNTARIAAGTERTDIVSSPRPGPQGPVGPVYAPPLGMAPASVGHAVPEPQPVFGVAPDSPFAPPPTLRRDRAPGPADATVVERATAPSSEETVARTSAIPGDERTVLNRRLPVTSTAASESGVLPASAVPPARPTFAPPTVRSPLVQGGSSHPPPAWLAPPPAIRSAQPPGAGFAPGSTPPNRPTGGPAQGGLPRPPDRPQRRLSAARFYYAALAILGVIVAISSQQPKVLLGAAACAAYSVYLFRGGRFVIWIW